MDYDIKAIAPKPAAKGSQITMRDQFAMAALARPNQEVSPDRIAREAYEVAEAMMLRRRLHG